MFCAFPELSQQGAVLCFLYTPVSPDMEAPILAGEIGHRAAIFVNRPLNHYTFKNHFGFPLSVKTTTFHLWDHINESEIWILSPLVLENHCRGRHSKMQ